MAHDVEHRQARGDCIAEALHVRAVVALKRKAADHGVFRVERISEFAPLVGARVAGQVAEAGGDFLQAEHVEVSHCARFGELAREVDAPVRAAAPLDVPRQDNGAHAGPPVSYNAALVPNLFRLARVSSCTHRHAVVF